VGRNHQNMSPLASSTTEPEIILVGNPPAGVPPFFLGTICDPAQFWREASAIHRAVFGREVSEEVAKRYAEAHGVALSRVDITQSRWMQRILEKGADLEALEFALRIRQPDHVLCQKFKLLIYIAEAFPEYYADFVNEAPRRASAFYSLARHGLRTLFKHLKAWWLFRRFV
jgi:hypothetical protein